MDTYLLQSSFPTKDLVPATQTLPSTNSQIRLTVQAWEYLLPL
jgi:hypothetical protein